MDGGVDVKVEAEVLKKCFLYYLRFFGDFYYFYYFSQGATTQSLVRHDAAEVVGPVSLELWAQVFFKKKYSGWLLFF